MLDSGEDPLAVARKFQDRLYGLHIKDFVFDRAGRPKDVIVGTGNLDLEGLAAFLTDIAFDGYLTLEYEGDVDDPVPATKECVDAVWAAFAQLG
jgi:sugar phosphate isomerase/epimerase